MDEFHLTCGSEISDEEKKTKEPGWEAATRVTAKRRQGRTGKDFKAMDSLGGRARFNRADFRGDLFFEPSRDARIRAQSG